MSTEKDPQPPEQSADPADNILDGAAAAAEMVRQHKLTQRGFKTMVRGVVATGTALAGVHGLSWHSSHSDLTSMRADIRGLCLAAQIDHPGAQICAPATEEEAARFRRLPPMKALAAVPMPTEAVATGTAH